MRVFAKVCKYKNGRKSFQQSVFEMSIFFKLYKCSHYLQISRTNHQCSLGHFVFYILRFTKQFQMVGNLQFLNTKYIYKNVLTMYILILMQNLIKVSHGINCILRYTQTLEKYPMYENTWCAQEIEYDKITIINWTQPR